MPYFEVHNVLTYFRAFKLRVPEKHTECSRDWFYIQHGEHKLPTAVEMFEAPGSKRKSLSTSWFLLFSIFQPALTAGWTLSPLHMHPHYSWTLYESASSGCVSPRKDHRSNAKFLYRRQQGISDNQSPPKPDKHRQKQAVVFSTGELMFSFLAVYPRHCPPILPWLILFMVLYLDLIPPLPIC